MHFALLQQNWTDETASLWGDMLDLGRPASFDEAKKDLAEHGFDGSFEHYFDGEGKYKGPCALGISVEGRDEPNH